MEIPQLPDDIFPLILRCLPIKELQSIALSSKRNLVWLAARSLLSINYLRGGPTSKAPLAKVVEISGMNAKPYHDALTDFDGTWMPSQVLYCCQDDMVDNEDEFCPINASAGATWRNRVDSSDASAGQLVIDMGTVRKIARFSVFQMHSDGKVTHIQFFRHSATGSTAPKASAADWVPVCDEVLIGRGSVRAETRTADDPFDESVFDADSDRITGIHPTKIAVTPFKTRYLRVHARNTALYDGGSYIEVMGIKAFGPAPLYMPDPLAFRPPGHHQPVCAPATPQSNLLRYGRASERLARVVAIAAVHASSGVRPYKYRMDVVRGSWLPAHALYAGLTEPDNPLCFNGGGTSSEGSTWVNNMQLGTHAVGCLVVDLYEPRDLQCFSVFQMFSDGKVTHVQLYAHPSMNYAVDAAERAAMPASAEAPLAPGATSGAIASVADTVFPDIDDDGWLPMCEWLDIDNTAMSPACMTVLPSPVRTRYLRIDCRNDGRHGNPGYIELRGIKGFGPALAAEFRARIAARR